MAGGLTGVSHFPEDLAVTAHNDDGKSTGSLSNCVSWDESGEVHDAAVGIPSAAGSGEEDPVLSLLESM